MAVAVADSHQPPAAPGLLQDGREPRGEPYLRLPARRGYEQLTNLLQRGHAALYPRPPERAMLQPRGLSLEDDRTEGLVGAARGARWPARRLVPRIPERAWRR